MLAQKKIIEVSVLIPFSLLGIIGIHSNLFIILLQGSHILPSFRELTLLHIFANIPEQNDYRFVYQIRFTLKLMDISHKLTTKKYAN